MDYTVSEAQRAITELYVGIFNRAPDPEGLAFWTDKLVIDGADIDVVTQRGWRFGRTNLSLTGLILT